MNDGELLKNYTATRSDETFRLLIERYLRLVYSACARQLKDAHQAEDATQAVFILLSRKAGMIREDRVSGWLLTTARYACANIRKTERRRAYRERVIAMEKSTTAVEREEELAGMLDEAMGHLGAADREAVVLRYLREQSLREVGEVMGVTEEAARKRVDRAVEKLRHYFARRGVATTAAAIATLLPAQAQAAMRLVNPEVLTQSILQMCHAGAANAAPAMAIAKGTNMMMAMHGLKNAAAAAMLIAVLGAAGWWGVSRSLQAETLVAVATAPAMVVDLSTPEKALESYCKAMKAGDRAAVYACTTTDPNHTPTAGDAFLVLSLGQNRLIAAAGKAFKSTDAEVRQFPGVEQILERVLIYDRRMGQTAVIEGNSATLPFNLPETVLSNLPADVQTQVRDFINHPLKFTRQGKEWKMGPSEARVTITLKDKEGRVVEDTKMQIEVVTEYGAIYDRVAEEIGKGEFASWEDAHAGLRADIDELHTKYHLSDIEVALSPKKAN